MPLGSLAHVMKPISVKSVSINLTGQLGENDALLFVRVVPNGRDGSTVYGRTLNPGEPDSDVAVEFFPYRGDELHFEVGSLNVYLNDLFKTVRPDENGYLPIANVLWTWMTLSVVENDALFRFLIAAARRLDSANRMLISAVAELQNRDETFIRTRQRLMDALGSVEAMCVALSRVIDMLGKLETVFGVPVALTSSSTECVQPLTELRNAFEHIEDRAMGQVRNKPHPDALSIFDQRDLLRDGTVRYAKHSLNLYTDIPALIADSKRAILETARTIANEPRTVAERIAFPSAPAGSHDMIEERAYYLWLNQTGNQRMDDEANWHEAEKQHRLATESAA